METKALVARTWDDVVFENRHKNYGAYFIRKSYEKSMMTGLGISVSLACLLIVVPNVLALFGKKIDVKIPTITEVVGTVILPPPPIETIQPPATPPPPQEPPAPQTSAANIQVTDRETDTQVVTNEEVVTPSTEEGDGPPIEVTGPPVVAPPIEVPVVPTGPVTIAEVMPSFEDMGRFFSRNLRYPSSARRLGISGRVFVGFVVDKEGKVVDVKVVRGIHPDCDKEAIRVVSMMPKWSPGMQNKQAVAVRMVLPINFQMQ
jgi:periplasmic protein TonB